MRINKLLERYVEFFRRKMFNSPSSLLDTVDLWRNLFFFRIVLVILPVSVVVYILGATAGILAKMYGLIFFDTVGMLIIIFIAFDSSFSILFKKILFLFTIYFLGIMLFYYLGFFGPALIYLMAVSILSALIINEKVAVATFVLNLVLFIYFIISVTLNVEYKPLMMNASAFLAVGINFMAFNLILIIAVISLITHLREALTLQGNIKAKLLEESAKLQIAKQRAEQSDSFKTGFIQDVSHGIQIPLKAIKSFSDLVNNENIEIEKRRYFIDIISSNAKLLQNIVHDLQILSTIENNQVIVTKSTIELNKVIGELITVFSEEYKDKNIGIIFKQKIADGRDNIETDEALLKKIIINLLSNALKYTELGFVEIGYVFRNECIEIFVKDTGIGIAPEQLKNLFNRFYRVENAINSRHAGTGLGLSLARANAQALGGELTCNSMLHVGTTFYLSVPIK